MNRAPLRALAAVILTTAISACDSQPIAESEPSTGPGGKADDTNTDGRWSVEGYEDPLIDQLTRVHAFYDASNSSRLRVYETSGGDPAINGNRLLLSIEANDFTQEPTFWDLGIDVRVIDSIELEEASASLVIEVQEEAIDEDGVAFSRSREYAVDYFRAIQGGDDAVLSVRVEGQSTTIAPSPDLDPIAQIEQIDVVELDAVPAALRVLQTSGGDPALNGNRLLVNALSYDLSSPSLTWETDIDVREVEAISLDEASSRLVLHATADHLDDSGAVRSEPIEYAIEYTLDENGEFGDSLWVLAIPWP